MKYGFCYLLIFVGWYMAGEQRITIAHQSETIDVLTTRLLETTKTHESPHAKSQNAPFPDQTACEVAYTYRQPAAVAEERFKPAPRGSRPACFRQTAPDRPPRQVSMSGMR